MQIQRCSTKIQRCSIGKWYYFHVPAQQPDSQPACRRGTRRIPLVTRGKKRRTRVRAHDPSATSRLPVALTPLTPSSVGCLSWAWGNPLHGFHATPRGGGFPAIFAIFAVFALDVFLPRPTVSRLAKREPHVTFRWNAAQAVPTSMWADRASLSEMKQGGGDQRDRAMQRRLQNSAYAGS